MKAKCQSMPYTTLTNGGAYTMKSHICNSYSGHKLVHTTHKLAEVKLIRSSHAKPYIVGSAGNIYAHLSHDPTMYGL